MADNFLKVAPQPRVDFAAYGAVETVPLSKIQKLTGAFLARNWVSIPHVCHQDEADATELERFRAAYSVQHGAKVTALSFLARAVAQTLAKHPKFNASLDHEANHLVLKKYTHIGIAVDTPGGLLVPVIRDCDRRSVIEIAAEIAMISAKARTKGLTLAEMSGGCFSISSLGPMGGAAFTPIINAPEVAILGVNRLLERPARAADGGIEWRKTLPLSLSYDHRVLNGVDAARFMTDLRGLIETPEVLAA